MSGGSITNGWVGLKTDLFVAASGDFRTDVAPLAAAVSTRGTLWSAPLTYAYLALLVAILVVATVLCFPLEGLSAVRRLGRWPSPWSAGWPASGDGSRPGRSTGPSSRGAELSRLNPNTDHVICSCDLQTAESVFFSGRFVYSYRLGWGVPGDLPLARAVQASACLPGAFAPVVLPIGRHHFSLAGAGDDPLTRMLLTDGGVYDNMGTEWPLRLDARVREGGAPEPPPHTVDEVVVVNASAGLGVSRRASVTKPILGEITSLLAVKDVLYDQTTSVRRRLLDVRYRATRAGVDDRDRPPRGRHGADRPLALRPAPDLRLRQRRPGPPGEGRPRPAHAGRGGGVERRGRRPTAASRPPSPRSPPTGPPGSCATPTCSPW